VLSEDDSLGRILPYAAGQLLRIGQDIRILLRIGPVAGVELALVLQEDVVESIGGARTLDGVERLVPLQVPREGEAADILGVHADEMALAPSQLDEFLVGVADIGEGIADAEDA
jgi:hypothetical protein